MCPIEHFETELDEDDPETTPVPATDEEEYDELPPHWYYDADDMDDWEDAADGEEDEDDGDLTDPYWTSDEYQMSDKGD